MAASPAAFGQQVAGSANISLHPVVERRCVREYLDDLLACRRGPEPGLEPEVLVDVDELAPEQLFTRMVLWEGRRRRVRPFCGFLLTPPGVTSYGPAATVRWRASSELSPPLPSMPAYPAM